MWVSRGGRLQRFAACCPENDCCCFDDYNWAKRANWDECVRPNTGIRFLELHETNHGVLDIYNTDYQRHNDQNDDIIIRCKRQCILLIKLSKIHLKLTRGGILLFGSFEIPSLSPQKACSS